VLIDDRQGGVTELDGDGLAGVAEANPDPLAGYLDAAAAGHLPLDVEAGGRQRLRSGEADALELVPLAGRDGQGRLRHRTPSWVMTCMMLPLRRIRARCPASGEPTWMTWLPRVMIPAALNSSRRPQGQPVSSIGRRAEFVRRTCHVQRLVRPPVVVFLPPGIDGGLRFPDRGERTGVGQELDLQGLMPAFHLSRGGRGIGRYG
jgi:hypothetical protein